jgi:hypothetical protein
MPFRSVFIAVVLGSALVIAALLVHARRPAIERGEPTLALAEATGKCAECHRRETSAVVVEFEQSRHAQKGVNCLDCHRPEEGQPGVDHKGFVITRGPTAKNCAGCHAREYDQYARSRHAAAAWAAVNGPGDFTPEQLAQGERYHPTWVNRPPMGIGAMEGEAAVRSGCNACHAVGKPNADGSLGSCTSCHSRHLASIELAREPSTCGQCHLGPDHSQAEIYGESKHGALFAAQRSHMNLRADARHLTTTDMPVPTCSTCHMSGLMGAKVTHDTTERLSWFLFAPVSTRRPGYERGQADMKDICLKCHTRPRIDEYYASAERVVAATNDKVQAASAVVKSLRAEGLLTPQAFDEPIEFTEFDLWHYYGRTAKHGAFMGGADFVQWHGNYELLRQRVTLDAEAAELRAARPKPAATAPQPPR